MKLANDVRKIIVFIGHEADDEFTAVGTAFFIGYKKLRYLVTCRHVVEQLGDDPFHLRVDNIDSGESTALYYDPYDEKDNAPWHFHPDPSVDLAVMEAAFDFRSGGLDVLGLQDKFLMSKEEFEDNEIGAGDLCYAVGLFRLMPGKGRNLPIVHTGNIAMMPNSEKIPIADWNDKTAVRHTEGVLVQMTNLDGLSGSPVFVRPTAFEFDPGPMIAPSARSRIGTVQRTSIQLLGIWQGSWDGVASNFDPTRTGQRVPLGVGFVTPSYKLIELLESKSVVSLRKKTCAEIDARHAAKPDSSATPKA